MGEHRTKGGGIEKKSVFVHVSHAQRRLAVAVGDITFFCDFITHETDRQLKPPRRRGSLASRGGEVRHKKINGGRQSNGGLPPLLVGCAVYLIFNWQKQGTSQRHATSRRSQGQAGGFSWRSVAGPELGCAGQLERAAKAPNGEVSSLWVGLSVSRSGGRSGLVRRSISRLGLLCLNSSSGSGALGLVNHRNRNFGRLGSSSRLSVGLRRCW